MTICYTRRFLSGYKNALYQAEFTYPLKGPYSLSRSKNYSLQPTRQFQFATVTMSNKPQGITGPEGDFPKQDQGPPGAQHEMDPQPVTDLRKFYKPAGKLAGKTALVTRGDSGIGRAVAAGFVMEGADVAIVCLPEEKRMLKSQKN